MGLAVQRPAPPQPRRVLSTFSEQQWRLLSSAWGLSNDLVVPGDYDGDGKTDVAVAREGSTPGSQINWYILRSSDLGFQALHGARPERIIPFKTTMTATVNATSRFGVIRPAVSTYIRSPDNGFLAMNWGTANDLPIASYDSH